MRKYFCSADEYQHVVSLRDNYAGLAKKVLARKPGTVVYESHDELAATAKGDSLSLEAFSVREGSNRSPDGSLCLSPQFHKNLEEVLGEIRRVYGEASLQSEKKKTSEYPAIRITYGR